MLEWSETSGNVINDYAVERGRLVPVAKHFESLTTDGKRLEIVDEELVNGRWRSHRRYESAKP